MKKFVWLMMLMALLLSGCQSVPTFETLGNVYAPQPEPDRQKIQLILPQEASAQTVVSIQGTIYFCDGYEIVVETFSAGDLSSTVRSLTGFDAEALTVMQTKRDGYNCYECAWTSAGETGFQTGRTKIIDDGAWHYSLTVLAPSETAGQLQDQWQQLFESFGLAQS